MPLGNSITSFDFNPSGETAAMIDGFGKLLVSDMSTGKYIFHLRISKGGIENSQVCFSHFAQWRFLFGYCFLKILLFFFF